MQKEDGENNLLDRFYRRLRFILLYWRRPPWDTGISPPELMAFLDSHPVGRALDLGCGTGTNVITLARRGWQAVGVDFVPAAIAQAKRKARTAGVQAHFLVDDVSRLSAVQGPFDLILDMGCFHNLTETQTQATIQNVARLLAPGGVFMLYGFLKNDPSSQGPGIGPQQLAAIEQHLRLLTRQDGTDRGQRPSAWFTFQKPA